ncbi:gastrula zinc finger protein XlCGF7.1-like [Pomacea canaliculata]|uniref:gastrula zinc finger protein XlCGF7.1-like n=1 Tax=Pomacea canaliculata TaxID=400727 RepID=UPI000D726584|nr:gastrula zinc finger protein XlCGF7.1-like [Pomacea canaliculata]
MEESDDEFDSNSILPSSDDDVKEKRFPCGLCSKAFTTKRQFTDHVKVHARHPCSLCPFTGSTVRSVGLHELEAHNGKIQHKCPECGKTFRALHHIRAHILKIHRRRSRHLAKTCEVCGKVVSSHFSLINHRRTHTGEKPYNCDQCWRSFAAESSLRSHMLVHSDRRKRFQCRFCPKELLSRKSLKRHERIHQDLLDTYPCEFCGKCFNNKYNLKVHLRIHTGEKPYVCNICGVGFPQKNSIDVHMKKHKIIVKSDDLDAEIGLRGQPRFSTM